MKKLIVGVAVLATLGFMVGNVSAASLDAGNTKMAAELIHPDNGRMINPINTAYTIEAGLAVTTQLKVALENAEFLAGSIVSICDGKIATPVTSGTVAADALTVVKFAPLIAPMNGPATYNLQNGPVCVVPSSPLASIKVPAGAAASEDESAPTTVTMKIDSITNPGDPKVTASATVLTVLNQFTASVVPVTAKLQFPDMKTFMAENKDNPPDTPNANDTVAALKIISRTDFPDGQAVAVAFGPDGCGPIDASSSLMATLTGDLRALDDLYYNDAAGVPVPAKNAKAFTAAEKTAQEAERSFAGNKLVVCRAAAKAVPGLLLRNTGKEVIAAGERDVELVLAGGAGGPANAIPNGYKRVVVKKQKGFDIRLHSSKAYIPSVTTNAQAAVTCFVNNMGALDAAVSADIVSSEPGKTQSGIELGTAKAGYSSKVLFEGKSVKGIDGKTTTIAIDGTTTKYSVRFNVDAPQGDITFFCNQADPATGGQKPTPVMRDDGVRW